MTITAFVPRSDQAFRRPIDESDVQTVVRAVRNYVSERTLRLARGNYVDPILISPRTGRLQRNLSSLAIELGLSIPVLRAIVGVAEGQGLLETEVRSIQRDGRSFDNVLFVTSANQTHKPIGEEEPGWQAVASTG